MFINRAKDTLTLRIYRFNVSWSLRNSKLSLQISNVEAAELALVRNQQTEQTQLKLRYLETLRKTELTYQ